MVNHLFCLFAGTDLPEDFSAQGHHVTHNVKFKRLNTDDALHVVVLHTFQGGGPPWVGVCADTRDLIAQDIVSTALGSFHVMYIPNVTTRTLDALFAAGLPRDVLDKNLPVIMSTVMPSEATPVSFVVAHALLPSGQEVFQDGFSFVVPGQEITARLPSAFNAFPGASSTYNLWTCGEDVLPGNPGSDLPLPSEDIAWVQKVQRGSDLPGCGFVLRSMKREGEREPFLWRVNYAALAQEAVTKSIVMLGSAAPVLKLTCNSMPSVMLPPLSRHEFYSTLRQSVQAVEDGMQSLRDLAKFQSIEYARAVVSAKRAWSNLVSLLDEDGDLTAHVSVARHVRTCVHELSALEPTLEAARASAKALSWSLSRLEDLHGALAAASASDV